MPACRQAGEQAGGQECLPPGKKECLPVRGAIGFKQVKLLWAMPPRGLLNAFLPLLSYRFLFCSLAFHRPNACMPVCRQAGTRAGRLAGGRTGRQECPPPGKKECLPVRKSESLQAGSYAFFTCVAAFGAVVAACGVFEPYFRPGKHPTFAPKRQGKAESAYRRPRLRPSFGQQKGIGQPMPCRVGNDRSIPNPSGTDFCVL